MKRPFIPIPPPAPLPQGERIDPAQLLSHWAGLAGAGVSSPAGKDAAWDLLCIMGPTASGKTRYAVSLARAMNALLPEGVHCEIISADSRQVFRRMDIGTGKDREEYGEIPVHLIDIAEPGEDYNIFSYQRDFAKVYGDIRQRGCLPILCGGSGLYVEAVTRAYDFGKGAPAVQGLPRHTYYIATLVSREVRRERIARRLDERLENGMIEEIQALLDEGIPAEKLLRYGLEYRFVTLYLQGELTREQLREQLYIAICQFAKRQMTWLRGMEKDGITVHWTEAVPF